MGVLDLNSHLKHRIKITDEDNEDSTMEEPDLPVELPTEPLQPTKSQRRHKSKARPHYFLNTDSSRPKGSRSGRRYENTCFLLSLVDHEELQELELSDIVCHTMTMFSVLFEDPEKMKIWSDFTSLTEEEQYEFVHRQKGNHTSTGTSCAAVTENDRDIPTNKMYAVAEKSYLDVDKKIRRTFQRKHFALAGELEILENDMISCLSDLPDAVIISKHPSSLDRMMVRAICQYLKLACRSHNCRGSKLMEIENRRCSFVLPQLLLSQYLKKKAQS